MSYPFPQKLRVVSTFGQGAALGLMDPKVGMPTQLGYVSQVQILNPGGSGVWTPGLGLSGSGQVEVGSGLWRNPNLNAPSNASGHYWLYAHQLNVQSGDAAAFGWPSGADCVVFGHGTKATDFNNGNDHSNNIFFLNAGASPSGIVR